MPLKKKNQTISGTSLFTDDEVRNLLQEHQMIEENLIGSLINDSTRIEDVFELITENDFYDTLTKNCFNEMIELVHKGKIVNIVNMTEKIPASHLIYLSGKASLIDYRDLCDRIKKNKLIRDLYSNISDSKNLIIIKDNIEKIISSIQVKTENVASALLPKIKSDAETIIKELMEVKTAFSERKMIGYPTWDSLDRLVDGFIVPNIWIVGGMPGTGKTFFMLQLVERMLRNDAKIVIFSTENSRVKNMLRLIGCHTGIPELNILKGNLSDEEKELIKQTEKYIASKILFIYEDVFTTADIRMKMQYHVKKQGVNIFVVDYIQLLNAQDDNYEQMRGVAHDLQRISKDLKCGVIALSQVANDAQKTNLLFRTYFKGAGEIGAIADVAIELKKSEKDFNSLGVMVKKVRHGRPGKLQFITFSEQNYQNKNYIEDILI